MSGSVHGVTRVALLLGGLAALGTDGCVRLRARAELAPPPAEPLGLEVRALVVERGAQPERLTLEEPLATGDHFAVVVSATEPLFVYAVGVSPDGTAHVISDDGATCVGAEPARLPVGGWYVLEEPAGQEVIGLVAWREEITQGSLGDAWLTWRVREEARRRDLMQLQATSPPGFADGHATMGLRAEHLRATRDAVLAFAYDEPVVVLVDIDHREPEEPDARE